MPDSTLSFDAEVVVRGASATFHQEVTAGHHSFQVDEPASVGGKDAAPTPYDYILAALGSCTPMTIGLYARKKGWTVDDIISRCDTTASMREIALIVKLRKECSTRSKFGSS